MDKLKQMKECMVGIVESQIYGNIDKVDSQELGAAVDIIKDLSEAIYYCSITEAMEKEKTRPEVMYSTRVLPPYDGEYYDPRYRERVMYARNGANSSSNGGNGGSMYHDGREIYRDGIMMRDPKEGRSGERRKMYMDGKRYKDKAQQMQDLDAYMQELAQDMAEMIQDASPEEKQLLQSKIGALATKIK